MAKLHENSQKKDITSAKERQRKEKKEKGTDKGTKMRDQKPIWDATGGQNEGLFDRPSDLPATFRQPPRASYTILDTAVEYSLKFVLIND